MEIKIKNLTLTNDLLFRGIFGKKGNEHLLKELVNAVLSYKNLPLITHIRLKSPITKIGHLVGKQNILDILGVDNLQNQYAIEMQVLNHLFLRDRMSYYLAKLHTDQNLKGKPYSEIKKSVLICFMDENFYNDKYFFRTAQMRSDVNYEQVVMDKLEFHLIEMKKLMTVLQNCDIIKMKELEKWVYFIKNIDKTGDKNMETLLKENPAFNEAEKEYEEIIGDEEKRLLLLHQEIWEMDRISEKACAREEGLSEGWNNGVRQTKLETAKLMKRENCEISFISKITGLSLNEIKNL